MGDKPVIEGTRGVLVWCGLGTPTSRGFVAGALVGVAAYALGMPKQCFTEEGELRPFKGVSKDPHAISRRESEVSSPQLDLNMRYHSYIQ